MHYLGDKTERLLIWLWSDGGSGVWNGYKRRTVSMRFRPDNTFGGVRRKHLQELAGSKGYGGALATLEQQGDKMWESVIVNLTAEGQRWADSPYLRSKHSDHPSHPEAKQQETIETLQRKLEKLAQVIDRLDGPQR